MEGGGPATARRPLIKEEWMQKLRKYMLPIVLAVVLGLSACGDTAGNGELEDSQIVPGAVEEGEGGGEGE